MIRQKFPSLYSMSEVSYDLDLINQPVSYGATSN
jgi:hypothetical protein